MRTEPAPHEWKTAQNPTNTPLDGCNPLRSRATSLVLASANVGVISLLSSFFHQTPRFYHRICIFTHFCPFLLTSTKRCRAAGGVRKKKGQAEARPANIVTQKLSFSGNDDVFANGSGNTTCTRFDEGGNSNLSNEVIFTLHICKSETRDH